jgi:hypothetical protein
MLFEPITSSQLVLHGEQITSPQRKKISDGIERTDHFIAVQGE